MQCFRRCLLALAGFAATAVIVAAVLAWNLGAWLDDSDAPAPTDAIVVLADDPSRAFAAADLYRKGYARKIYVTVPRQRGYAKLLAGEGIAVPRTEELFRRALLARGVPEAAIGTLGRDLASTRAEAETARAEFAPAARLLIVTSPYHVRRARMIFRDALPGRELRFIGSRYEPYPERWWTDQDAARNVILELPKIAFYLAGGRF